MPTQPDRSLYAKRRQGQQAMRCPVCKYEWKLPGPQAGGRAKVRKGFAVRPLSAEARARGLATRRRGWGANVQPLVGSLDSEKE